MKKDEIFFGENGLTSTSANHIANMAKEMYQTLEKEMANMTLYSTCISTVSGENVKCIGLGKSKNFLDTVEEKIARIAELKSLIAWLREAMKARQKMVEEVDAIDMTTYCKMNGIEKPEMDCNGLVMPKKGEPMSEDEYFGTLSIDKRNRYYELETKAATIGKYIHEDGTVAKARMKLKDIIEQPALLIGSDASALLQTYNPSVSVDDADALFFRLENLHREYQKELNSMKFDCEKACHESKLKVEADYQAERAAFDNEYTNRNREYMSKSETLRSKLQAWKEEESARIMNLKIVVPDSLKRVFNEVNSVGKDKE